VPQASHPLPAGLAVLALGCRRGWGRGGRHVGTTALTGGAGCGCRFSSWLHVPSLLRTHACSIAICEQESCSTRSVTMHNESLSIVKASSPKLRTHACSIAICEPESCATLGVTMHVRRAMRCANRHVDRVSLIWDASAHLRGGFMCRGELLLRRNRLLVAACPAWVNPVASSTEASLPALQHLHLQKRGLQRAVQQHTNHRS